MGFDAGSAVDPMDYNFEKYGGSKGTIPEPSQKAMRTFEKALKRVQRGFVHLDERARAEGVTDEELEKIADEADELSAEFDKAIAKVCQDLPSVEEIEKLPHRIKLKFSSWLLEQFSPE